ncbi:MAG: hypothetical protein HY703_13070 [Gemmatimonadetes bacterium]|nr:hypothetical protein [Gemmatimonadota bacterium]
MTRSRILDSTQTRIAPDWLGRGVAAPAAVAAAVLLLACGGRDAKLDTRTYRLQHLNPEAAVRLIEPYVYADRKEAPGRLAFSPEAGAVTVTETRDNLEKIARVLGEFDQPRPGITLHFQIIEADGAAAPDPALAQLEGTLRQLFRFKGYRLLAEALVQTQERSNISQRLAGAGGPFHIRGGVGEVRSGARTTLELGVELQAPQLAAGEILSTQVNIVEGQTVVLGTAQPDPRRGALILTVKADRPKD